MRIRPLDGTTNCCVSDNYGQCDAPGQFHAVMELLDEGTHFAFLCNPHFLSIEESLMDELPAHFIGPDCGMPGTYWYPSDCRIS